MSTKNIRACADRTRENILKSAIKLFSKKGYSATTIRDIAKHAKVHLNLIFHHFKSKEMLWQAVGEVVHQKYQMCYLEHGIPQDLKSTIESFIFSRYKFFKDNHDYYRILKWKSIEENNKLNFSRSTYQSVIRPHLIDLQKRNLIRSDVSVDVIALYMASALMGAFDKRNVFYQSDNPEVLQKAYLEFIAEELFHTLKPK